MSGQAKAELWEVDAKDKGVGKTPKVTVQFNPETLRITHASQFVPSVSTSSEGAATATGVQTEPRPPQHAGPGSTRLSVQLWFDVTSLMSLQDEGVTDVRALTEKVAYFMTERKLVANGGSTLAPPRVQFRWGSVVFSGVMDSLDENLELFSTGGVPLRASMNIGISQGKIGERPAAGAGGPSLGLNLSAGIGIGASASLGVGTQPLAQAEAGVSLQAMASASFGADADWQSIATANGIENPRLLQPGQLVNMNARASAPVASASASASFNLTGE